MIIGTMRTGTSGDTSKGDGNGETKTIAEGKKETVKERDRSSYGGLRPDYAMSIVCSSW